MNFETKPNKKCPCPDYGYGGGYDAGYGSGSRQGGPRAGGKGTTDLIDIDIYSYFSYSKLNIIQSRFWLAFLFLTKSVLNLYLLSAVV